MSLFVEPRGKLIAPPPGCEQWETEQGYSISQIHYSADPSKDAAWEKEARRKCPSDFIWRQEYEIDAYARSGALMYPEYSKRIHIYEPFPIPHTWTRYMGCDPHKRRPHAFLWLAVDPWNDIWVYREYWPSKICGKPGNVPEDDELYTIHQYAEAIKFFEGEEVDVFAPGGFADNQGKRERIFRRIMDTHGKAIFAETHDGKDDPETFWDRYREEGLVFYDAKKDVDAGRDAVGRALRPRQIADENGVREEPRLKIFTNCTELQWELRHNRFPTLTPEQAEKQDPVSKELQKRKHMTDILRYLVIADPVYIDPGQFEPEYLRAMSLPPRVKRTR